MAATTRQEANLQRLRGETRNLVPAGRNELLCQTVASRLPLCHSDTCTSFAKICASGQLLSTSAVAALTGRAVDPTAEPEYVLGTEDCAFFYVGAFRYPGTSCGIIFTVRLEQDRTADASATPFDSGGLVHHYPPSGETPRAFFERHQLPALGFRDYLKDVLLYLFNEPLDYVRRTPPVRPGPVTLIAAGADERIWTFEVQIRGPVSLRVKTHLEAVFAPRLPPSDVESFLDWCWYEGIHTQYLHIPWATEDRGFELLRAEAEKYITGRFARRTTT